MRIAKRRVVLISLVALTMMATATKIFIGLDFDENYITVLGGRLLQGDHLFRECWDLYQTTGLTMALCLRIFKGITGGYEGAILFCRIVTAVLQLLLGVFTWYSLKNYFRNADMAGLIVANMLPRGTLNLEYGFLSCNYILVAMILLFLAVKESEKAEKNRIRLRLILAGIAFSMGILSYPTMILTVFVLFVYFWEKREYRKQGAVFIGTCVVCAAAFFLYVFAYVSPSEMWHNIFQGILLDESHGNGNLLRSFWGSFVLSKEKALQACVIIVGSSISFFVLDRWMKERVPYVCHVMFLSSLAIIGLNLLAIRPCGVYGLQIRYFLITVVGGSVFSKLQDKELLYLFYLTGVFMFLGTLFGSNLSIVENGAFLYTSIIAIVIGMGEWNYTKRITQEMVFGSIVVFLLSLVVMKGYIVRINVTEPANILETREQLDFGPFKGIYVYPQDKQNYLIRKEDIDNALKEEDIVLILSQDPIYNLYGQYRFSSATALTTPVYGKQWVEYYQNRRYVQPSVVLIDKQYLNAESLLNQTMFGNFLTEEYDMESLTELEGFWMLRRF